jgi:hypothetical protein
MVRRTRLLNDVAFTGHRGSNPRPSDYTFNHNVIYTIRVIDIYLYQNCKQSPEARIGEIGILRR